MLHARARHETGQRRTRLLDLAVALHPGKDGKSLTKLSRSLEKASKPPRPNLSAADQAEADVSAALAHLMG